MKLKIFADLDRIAGPAVILASNTSSISLTRIAGATKRPAQVIGMHFFNPVPVMQLVELIRALQTSDATYETVKTLTVKLGKTPVEVKNSPGFVANRILLPMLNEAAYCLYENLATAEDVDTVMKLGMAHPMGPLALADLIGLDTCLSILQVLYDGFKDPSIVRVRCGAKRSMPDSSAARAAAVFSTTEGNSLSGTKLVNEPEPSPRKTYPSRGSR